MGAGLVNPLIRPVPTIITLPIHILTPGLLPFEINDLLFWFVASFVKAFTISGFWHAALGAIDQIVAIWAISMIKCNPVAK